MESYHVHKDHHYWDTAKWDADYEIKPAQQPEPEPKPEKEEPIRYRSHVIREKDGSVTYLGVRESNKVVRCGAMMV